MPLFFGGILLCCTCRTPSPRSRWPPLRARRRHPIKGFPVWGGGDAAVLRTVAVANVDRAAAANHAYQLASRSHLFGRFDVRRGIGLALIVICHIVHQSLMGFTAIETLLLDAGLLPELPACRFRFRSAFHEATKHDDDLLSFPIFQGCCSCNVMKDFSKMVFRIKSHQAAYGSNRVVLFFQILHSNIDFDRILKSNGGLP